MTIRFLDCMGSHYMVGLQQGRLAKQAIHTAWEVFSDSQQLEMIRKSKLAPKSLYLIHCQQKADNFLKKVIKDALPEQHERIKGLATGADISEKIVYLLQAMEMELMPKQNMYALGSGTLIGIHGDATTTGEPVLMKTFDHSLPFRDMLLVRRNKPMAGCQTLDTTLAFSAGGHAGLNDHGLAIMHTWAYPTDSMGIKSIPFNIILQEALETCYTTEEAVRLINRHSRDAGASVLIVDASGDMRIIETSRSDSAQRVSENKHLIAANHYMAPQMAKLQIPLDARWGDKALPGLKGESIYQSSLSRYKRAVELLGDSPIDPETVEEILSDHYGGNGNDDTICRHSQVFSTIAAIIIYPKRRTIRVLGGKPCEGTYEEFAIKKV